MNRPVARVVGALLSLAVCPAARAEASGPEAHDAAVEAAVDLFAQRVVQLRYLGDTSASLGAAGAPVSGLSLDGGWVLTSTYSLEEDPVAILCQFADGAQAKAQMVARDKNRKYALLRVEGEDHGDLPRLPEFRDPRIGETAIALGRVYSVDRVNVTVGVVSAVGRLGGRALQTDALASPVNYGGPLVGLDGSLLGLLSPLAPPGQSGVGLYDSGVGFAVGAKVINDRLETLAGGDDLLPGWLGVSLPTDDPLRQAAVLSSVAEDSPAEQAGLEKGDTVTSLAGEPTPNVWSLKRVVSGLDAGQTVRVEFLRSGSGDEPTASTTRLTLGVEPEPKKPLFEGIDLEALKKPDGP